MAVHSNTDWVLRIPGVTNPAESPLDECKCMMTIAILYSDSEFMDL